MKILVTPRSVTRDGHASLERLRAAGWEMVFCRAGVQPDEEELLALLPGCAGYLAGVEAVTERVLGSEAARELRVISRNGAGVDNIDLAAAEARGIAVVRAEGANARGVAELTLGFVLALARGMVPAAGALRDGKWVRGGAGMEVEGKVMGLIGCGRVGKMVARMALGCDMRVRAYDSFPDPSFMPAGDFAFAGLGEVLSGADFVSLHCPPAEDGTPVLGAAGVARMKHGAFLINTARYEAMDAEAVLGALETGHVAGVALDGFDAEPPEDVRLVQHPRVLGTPHLGAYTRESIDRAMEVAVENLLRALGGVEPGREEGTTDGLR